LRPSDRIDVVVDTLKNAGAELINKLALGKTLKWEEGYGVLSLRNKDIEIVSDYIRTQKERHKKGDLIAKMEKTK
jgi:REP element-mobilizing transposase RayT